jgi:hypothetical protein
MNDQYKDSYTTEKLFQAVDSLVSGAGPIHQRLSSAADFIRRIRTQDVPAIIADRFQNVLDHLSRDGQPDELEDKKIAEEILGMFIDMKGGL